MENTTPNPYFTIKEAAKFAGLEPSSIRFAIRTGDLDSRKIWGRTYVRSSDLREHLRKWVIDYEQTGS